LAQPLSRLAGVDQVELGVQSQGVFEQCLRAFGSAELQLDHSGMKIQKRIFRAEGECLLYSIGGLGDAPILEKHPRQDVPRVDIMRTSNSFFANSNDSSGLRL
jgi:hypothetical protein